MGTRGYICIERELGICEGFYNHFDNYPEGTGLILITTRGGHTGNITDIQNILGNDKEVETSFNWTDAFAKGNEYGCDWFYVRKEDIWYCMSYNASATGLVTVAEAIIEATKAPLKEEYEWLNEKYMKLQKERQ